MPQHVVVVEYNPLWKEMYRQEAAGIRNILGDNLDVIYHIGSTSVPGLRAKPVIDIMPVVLDLSKVDPLFFRFEGIGYECMGEFGIPGRRFFRKGGDERTHHIHIFQQSNKPDIERHLAVREYLRNHEDVALRYGRLKSELAARFPDDIEGYCDGKDAFMKEMEQEALRWYSGADFGFSAQER